MWNQLSCSHDIGNNCYSSFKNFECTAVSEICESCAWKQVKNACQTSGREARSDVLLVTSCRAGRERLLLFGLSTFLCLRWLFKFSKNRVEEHLSAGSKRAPRRPWSTVVKKSELKSKIDGSQVHELSEAPSEKVGIGSVFNTCGEPRCNRIECESLRWCG